MRKKGTLSAITLRKAEYGDIELLFQWRNALKTRKASHQSSKIDREDHENWFVKSLNSSSRQIYIALEEAVPVGTVRMDRRDDGYELSWTVAPDRSGRGIGKKMVSLLAHSIKSPIHAEVKRSNPASAKIAEYAGMSLDHQQNGILFYCRGPLPEK